MATQKPISTISYNSEAFLKEKLEAWLQAHIIQAYQYIKHKGEDGDKDHIHLRIEPNKKLDPMDLQEQLREFVQGQIKPLGVRPFRPSKEEDWYLYAVHDEDYLKVKYGGGERGEKLPYSWQDIVVPDDYDSEIAFIRAKSSLRHSASNMASRLQHGENPISMVFEGENVYTINALMRALQTNDYQRLLEQCNRQSSYLERIFDALESRGLLVQETEFGELVIVDRVADPSETDMLPE